MGTSIAAMTALRVSTNNLSSQQAKDMACTAFVRDYEHRRATTAEMRDYVYCVDRLYPQPVHESTVVYFKVTVLVILLATIYGGWFGYRYRTFTDGQITNIPFGMFFGGAVGFLSCVAVSLAYTGLQFLFS